MKAKRLGTERELRKQAILLNENSMRKSGNQLGR
jgi:hypothetical protein